MIYWIEINVARRGNVPVWRDLVKHDGEGLFWSRTEDVRAVFAEEARRDARIMSCHDGAFKEITP